MRTYALIVIFQLLAPSNATNYTNPIYESNFADPSVIAVGNGYYAFATNGGGSNVPVLESPDLVFWSSLPDALPWLPSWAVPGYTMGARCLRVKGRRRLWVVLYCHVNQKAACNALAPRIPHFRMALSSATHQSRSCAQGAREAR